MQIITYVDGPFYANYNLTPKEAQEELRDRIYDIMCKRALNSNFETIKYIKK